MLFKKIIALCSGKFTEHAKALCEPNVEVFLVKYFGKMWTCWSQWPRAIRRGSATARLLVLRVRIPPGGMEVCLF
jgi:hypothetical protein